MQFRQSQNRRVSYKLLNIYFAVPRDPPRLCTNSL